MTKLHVKSWIRSCHDSLISTISYIYYINKLWITTMYTAMKYLLLHESLSGSLKYFNLICQNIKIILTDNYKQPLMHMAAVNKQPICGIQHCVLKVIMAGIVWFANWKYLVQTKLQNPFRKLGSCVHEYSWILW
jgi:hypothetical protein